ncbi:hypothetical protein LEP1GSC062_0283 [Leptospira alexanderi serovar Manhao 3 str. L 60]|uniref:Uncharacterized protein n=1 Tax=Leptospira alexanderi serovar Manhao 3 str. L 60 TaxID=1049759 RepID=V6HSE2_9LEPT|nr:hypothetical protein LEP1GSC062_0283 [Leptospira alexanderi serovar Manhao 3 str. L 60]
MLHFAALIFLNNLLPMDDFLFEEIFFRGIFVSGFLFYAFLGMFIFKAFRGQYLLLTFVLFWVLLAAVGLPSLYFTFR